MTEPNYPEREPEQEPATDPTTEPTTDESSDDAREAVDRVHAHLRRHHRGDLRFGEHMRPVRYAIDAEGLAVISAMEAMLRDVDTVLFIPDCSDHAMELMLTLTQFDENTSEGGALADLWRIHHGEPEDVRWARASIDAVRFDGVVIDGEALMRPNPLAGDVARLCRLMNAERRDDLTLLCTHFCQTDVADPRMVAIDPCGLDIRRKFDVVRVEFPRTVADAADAEALIDEMIAEAS